MGRYRVVYAISYDVDAEDEVEAEEKAYDMLAREIGESAAEIVAEVFGINVEPLDEEDELDFEDEFEDLEW
ncbi:MAG: hypothetical protein QXI60_07685 [Thermofilaceae archaeon]